MSVPEECWLEAGKTVYVFPSHARHALLVTDKKTGSPVKDSHILQGVSGVNCSVGSCIILLEYDISYPGHVSYDNRVLHSCHKLASI